MSSRATLVAVVALVVAMFAACAEQEPLRIETDAAHGFDPLRYDFGAEPEGEIGLERLRFSITPFYSPERQQEMLDRMRGWLEEKVGVPVDARLSDTYASALETLLAGELDVAQLSPSACVAVQRDHDDVDLVATAIAQGTTTYASYLVVREGSDIDRVQDAKGKRLALTQPQSASGFLYPWAWLRKQGLSPERDFDLVRIPQHDDALAALLAGEVDVAAMSSDTLVTRGVLGLAGPVRIIAKAGRIPYDCVAVRRALGPRMEWRVRRAFLGLSILTPEGRAVLRDYNLINGFLPVPKGHYDGVKALDEEYGAEVAAAGARIPLLEAARAGAADREATP